MRTFYLLSLLDVFLCAFYMVYHSPALTCELFTAYFLLDSSCSWVDCRIVFDIDPFLPVQDIKNKRLIELPIAFRISLFYLNRTRFDSAFPNSRIHYHYFFCQIKDFEKPSYWVSAFNLSES